MRSGSSNRAPFSAVSSQVVHVLFFRWFEREDDMNHAGVYARSYMVWSYSAPSSPHRFSSSLPEIGTLHRVTVCGGIHRTEGARSGSQHSALKMPEARKGANLARALLRFLARSKDEFFRKNQEK